MALKRGSKAHEHLESGENAAVPNGRKEKETKVVICSGRHKEK